MRAAFSADLELVKLLLSHGADPRMVSKDGDHGRDRRLTRVHQGYSKASLPPNG
jgi:hypothetical protein